MVVAGWFATFFIIGDSAPIFRLHRSLQQMTYDECLLLNIKDNDKGNDKLDCIMLQLHLFFLFVFS